MVTATLQFRGKAHHVVDVDVSFGDLTIGTVEVVLEPRGTRVVCYSREQIIAEKIRAFLQHQRFDDVVGQEHVARALTNAIKAGRVAHAYMFTGARGVGKTSTARILAKALNCPNAKDGVPCNQCEICEGISSGNDVDVLEIVLPGATHADPVKLSHRAGTLAGSRTRGEASEQTIAICECSTGLPIGHGCPYADATSCATARR